DTSTNVVLPSKPSPFRLTSVVAFLAGGQFRLVVGAGLFILCLLWVKQNQFFDVPELFQTLWAMVADGTTQRWDQLGVPLELWLAPKGGLDLFNSFNPGIAGLILMISAFLGGWRVSLLAWPAALVICLGTALIPTVGPVSGGAIGLAAGMALALFGLLVRR